MSTPSAKAKVIDADAHVVETERVWDYLEPTEEKYRPTLVTSPENLDRQFWPRRHIERAQCLAGFKAIEAVSDEVKQKIFFDNPKGLYGI